jgi:hypothetical protein
MRTTPPPKASCVGAATCLYARCVSCTLSAAKGRHAVAGAWSDGPLGGLKSWPTSHDARHDATQRSRHLWTARMRALHAYCVSCTLTAAKGAMLLPALGLKGTMRLHARHTPVDGAAACLHAYCGKERHTVAGAWAEEPLGGSKSWPTFHEATLRSPITFGRHGSAPCTLTACLARLLRQRAPICCRRLG